MQARSPQTDETVESHASLSARSMGTRLTADFSAGYATTAFLALLSVLALAGGGEPLWVVEPE